MQQKQPLGQYFTPKALADYMVRMLEAPKTAHVVEPCAGQGVFLSALNEAGYSRVTAIEIDPVLSKAYQSLTASFLTWATDNSVGAIIGNPPYIRWKNMTEEQKLEVSCMNEWGNLLNSQSDYLAAFIAHAVEVLSEGGELIFVTPSYWMRTLHSQKLRDHLLERGFISDVVVFGETKIFSKVTTETIVFRWVKGEPATTPIRLHRYVGPAQIPHPLEREQHFHFEDTPQFAKGSSWHYPEARLFANAMQLESWCSVVNGTTLLFKEESICTLGEIADIANGMVTGLDAAFRLDLAFANALPQTERSGITLVAKASGITPLRVQSVTPYIDLPVGNETELLKQFPNLMRIVNKSKTRLEARYKYYSEQPYWVWSFKRSLKLFQDNRTKVVVPCKERMTNKLHARFAMLPGNAVATQDVTAIALKHSDSQQESPEYICAYLNLPEVSDWFRAFGLMKGGIAEFSEAPLSRIPIRRIDFGNPNEREAHDVIARLVQRAALAKNTDYEKIIEEIRNRFVELGLPRQVVVE